MEVVIGRYFVEFGLAHPLEAIDPFDSVGEALNAADGLNYQHLLRVNPCDGLLNLDPPGFECLLKLAEPRGQASALTSMLRPVEATCAAAKIGP
ncbi:MAG TPA: hypothetical protein PLP01_01880 [Phycisphaerae bacterium]|nr:hypothetical protein [Phycisphaerae bacterium]